MMKLGPRGGKELRSMTCFQFETNLSEGVGRYYNFLPKKQESFKNFEGGVEDLRSSIVQWWRAAITRMRLFIGISHCFLKGEQISRRTILCS
eukprot:TRINITY_DN4060_c0_g1_i1.p1 TRINITY_DN4060_c0_g1~~TRINITY_DN4060_c0_g1_i1.p1  ORF type:complete len:92 (-),score=0.34 TRINITY_DN4060_c0_g1_i1:69-344(-)